MLSLAANTGASEVVRGQALYEIDELKRWMNGKLEAASPRQKAALLFGLSQVEEFKKNPDKFQPVPALDMPPGAPIGMPETIF